ncbi:hypothetical protein [Sphingomonas sp.]|jgi:hypothetical protein|uniref:hypothetical protein n=1 Tax=Sphingomonas sp. TaxID=28214 RepID=UPI003F72A5D3
MSGSETGKRKTRRTSTGDALHVVGKDATSVRFELAVAPSLFDMLQSNPSTIRVLMERFGSALAATRDTGKASGFSVRINPEGKADIAPLPSAAVRVEPPVAQSATALDAARERGRILAAQILDRDDMLTADAFAERLGVSRMTVNSRRQRNELLGLSGAKRGYRFPDWQVDEDGRAFAVLPRLFELLGGNPWTVYRFLTQHHNVLGGVTGRDALRKGDVERVIAAAQGVAEGDFA